MFFNTFLIMREINLRTTGLEIKVPLIVEESGK